MFLLSLNTTSVEVIRNLTLETQMLHRALQRSVKLYDLLEQPGVAIVCSPACIKELKETPKVARRALALVEHSPSLMLSNALHAIELVNLMYDGVVPTKQELERVLNEWSNLYYG